MPMRLADFSYQLPRELIAQHPLLQRPASRLLYLRSHSPGQSDRCFSELPALLAAGDLLVFNDTRVIPARLFARKTTGGRVELLVERILDAGYLLAQVRSNKSLRRGAELLLADGVTARVCGREREFYRLALNGPGSVMEILEAIGHIPLPPYIERADECLDATRYQTVFARHRGAVAAPTAGLHFDLPLLTQLQRQGIDQAYVTLHVGAGTFQPVRVNDIRQHQMHAERVSVSAEVCEQIHQTRARGGRVIAVGTTVARSLESAAETGVLAPFQNETRLFISPGFRFRVVDALITNFHVPESTLLMLVCAFGGRSRVLQAYRHAVREKYRFFSYGDAMLVESQMQEQRCKS